MNKRLISLIFILIIISSYLFLRSEYTSNALKDRVIPEIENILDSKVKTDKLYINLIPLFIGLNELRAYDNEGKEIIYAKKVKAYISFFELFNRKILIKRLSIKEPIISLEKKRLNELISSFGKSATVNNTEKSIKVAIKSIYINNANISIKDDNHYLLLSGLNSDIFILNKPEIRLSTEKIFFSKKDFLNIDGRINSHFTLDNNTLDIKSLHITLNKNSEIRSSGTFNFKMFSGELDTEINMLVDSLKNMFGLTNKGEGFLSIKGTIKAIDLKSDINNIFLNIRINGSLYLETLMELLKVKERLNGKLSFNGLIKGKINEIIGYATAQLENGDLFGVKVDKLRCQVEYAENKMRFTQGIASLYGGSATAEVTINLPIVDYFTLKVVAKDISSKGVFELIKWDPKLSIGKVNAEIASTGRFFNPTINFTYKNVDYGKDILERVGEIKGNFEVKDNLITFYDLIFSTPKSSLNAAGTVDLKNKVLNFTGSGKTVDVKDFSAPYFTAVSGAGNYEVILSGSFDNPVIDLNFNSTGISFKTSGLNLPETFNNKVFIYDFLKTSLIYDKNNLVLKDFLIRNKDEELSAKGNIYFKKAKKLFEISDPEYDLKINSKNAEILMITQAIKGLPELKGNLNANFTMKGYPASIQFSGVFNANSFYYKDLYIADNLEGRFSYAKKEFLISPATLRRNTSALNVNGKISLDKSFRLISEGKKIKINDVITKSQINKYNSNFFQDIYLENVSIKGEGSIENPNLEIKSNITMKGNKNSNLFKGNINARIIQKQADINLSLFDGRLRANGRVGLDDKFPWSINVDIKPANYARLISVFLKDAPDDMMLNLTSKIMARGDANNINADIVVNRLYTSLFGIGLSNNSDIIINIKNKEILIKNFSLHGDDAEVTLNGSASVGNRYDLILEGTSSIAPLKVLSKEIESLKGKAYFVISLTGDWKKPSIDGGIDFTGVTLAIKHIPYRMSSVSAYLYVDNDKVTIKNINGKFAGGDVFAYGSAYLDGFNVKNFLVETKLKDLTMSPMKGLTTTFDGSLFYRGTMKDQELIGDINIKKSKYTQRVEWKSWLLDMRKKDIPKINTSRLGQTSLNIKVKGDDLIIKNNIADTSANMDILVRGTISKPVLLGKLSTDRGLMYFRNNEFKVLKARIDFVDLERTLPYFDIVAETKIKNYHIRLSLDGNFEQFNLLLSSDPVLNESDILSLLTVGHLGKQMKGLEGSIGTSETTSFLSGKLQDVIEERFKTITGIDRIQIDPQVSKTTGTVNPRITMSKKILGDKLHITYSASTGTDEEQVWKLEYFLNKNMSFVGVRDERGGLGGDVKFRFEFK